MLATTAALQCAIRARPEAPRIRAGALFPNFLAKQIGHPEWSLAAIETGAAEGSALSPPDLRIELLSHRAGNDGLGRSP